MGLCQSAEAEHGGGKKHRKRKGKRAHDGEEPSSTRKHESSSRNNRKNENKKSTDRKSDPNGSGKHHQRKPAAVNPGGSGGAHPPKSSHDVIGNNHDTSLNSHGSQLLPPVIGFHPAADDTPLDEPQRQLTRPHSILKRSASNNNFSDDFTTASALAEAAEEAADHDAKSSKPSRSKQQRRTTLTPGESADASTAGDVSSRETSGNMPHSPYAEQRLHTSQSTASPPQQRTAGGPNGMGVSVCTAAPDQDDRGTPEHHRCEDGPREDRPAEITGNPLSVPPALPFAASPGEYDASRSGVGALATPMAPNSATRRTPGRVTFEVTEEEPGHAAEGAEVLPAAAVPTQQTHPVTTLEVTGATSTSVAARPPPPAPPTPPAVVYVKPPSSASSTATAAPPNAVIVTVRGQQYNLEPLLGKHPGGSAVLRQFKNRDATDQFLSSHSPPPFAALRKYEFPRQEL